MHMKHEHGDAHLCVCVGWRVIWGGGKPENIPRTQAASPEQMLKEGGKQMLHSPSRILSCLQLNFDPGRSDETPSR